MIEHTLIQRLESLIQGPAAIPEGTKQLIREIIEDTKRLGIEADIRSGWFSGEEIQRRWRVGSPKVTAIRKKLKSNEETPRHLPAKTLR